MIYKISLIALSLISFTTAILSFNKIDISLPIKEKTNIYSATKYYNQSYTTIETSYLNIE